MLDDLPRIQARLADHVKGVHGRVKPIGDLADAIRAADPTPSLFVLYRGYRPVDDLGTVDTRWIVVVRLRTARQTADAPGAALEDSGPIVEAVMDALVGWRPEAARHPMKLAAPEVAPGWLDGYVYLPLGFTARRVFSFPPN